MNTTTLLFILLGLWIFSLQSKINHLEKLVNGLKAKTPSLPLEEEGEMVKEDPKLRDTSPKEETTTQPLEVEEVQSTVRRLKESHLPREPSKIVSFISNYFTGGNLLVRIGGVILFFGLAFLVKYAAQHSVVSMQMKLFSIAGTAVALIIVGWRLRNREGAYGQILQGLGIAILYLVIYASSKFYALLSLDTAFLLMLTVVLLGSVLAVKENALPLSLFSTAGGFLVPVLTSGTDGSHVMLFSYYLLLNVGVFILAWYRSWRLLNVIGFLFTFVIATIWGVLRYHSELFRSTEPFLILFFILYLSISIFFTMKHTFRPKNFVDGTLVFGLPLIAFPLQVQLVASIPYGESYSAIVLGTLYAVLFRVLRKKENTLLLAHSFLAISVLFYTIAIPYLFDADVSAALWSLESAAILWLALKQKRAYARYFGTALLLLCLFIYPESVDFYRISLSEYLGYILIIIAGGIASYLLDTHREQLSKAEYLLPQLLLALSLILWFISTPSQLNQGGMLYSHAMLFSLTLGALILFGTNQWVNWQRLNTTLQMVLPFGMGVFFLDMLDTMSHPHPFRGWGGAALGSFMLLHYFFLYHYNARWKWVKPLHILSLWSLVLILTVELHYHIALFNMGKSTLSLASIALTLMLSLGLLLAKHYPKWLKAYQSTYQVFGVGGLVIVIIVWEWNASLLLPDFTYMDYMPLLNPLDLTQILGLCVAGYWVYSNNHLLEVQIKTVSYGILSLMLILLATVIFARAVHLIREVDYTLLALWGNNYFHTGLSILWSLIAIVLMSLSKRYHNRPLWMGGFGLLLLVVLKLFFVELASSGTIERIISFIVVGTLLLLIGYFVPLPPNNKLAHKN